VTQPPSPEARGLRELCDRGMALHRAGRLAEAKACYENVLARAPNDFDALHLLGLVLVQSGQGGAGATLIRRALAVDPEFAEAHANLGQALMRIGRPEEALAAFDAALARKPALADARAGRAAALDEIIALSERLIAQDPRRAEAHGARGSALLALGRSDAALASFDAALALHPTLADAHYSRGLALQALWRFEEAVTAYDQALALRPVHADAHNNRALALQELGRHGEALAGFEAALRVRPNHADARLNRGMARLLHGDFEGGWPDYEWRGPDRPGRGEATRAWLARPDVAGQRLWLQAEQGLGDTIQFARYAKLLSARGIAVTLSVQTTLKPLLETLGPDIEVLGERETPARYDHDCPLLSLPLAMETRLETIPAWPGYLEADAGRREAMAARLGPRRRPRVGIVWSGNAALRKDRRRSVPFDQLEPLLAADVDWHALQIEIRPDDADAFRRSGSVAFHGEALKDFADTAALIAQMDLVISVDTGVAHLAGALGKPVWILLPINPDWRWLLGRADSPWYPSARLFRQTRAGDWSAVIAAVRSSLELEPIRR
jgi:tetratricopeptide (TPR) repeat protein